MQGTFSSDVATTPAVTATGTNGAEAIRATSDKNAIIAVSEHRGAVVANTIDGIAVTGYSHGQGGQGIGVYASSRTGMAVSASSDSGIAVLAQSSSNVAVHGECLGGDFGVVGKSPNAGVAAFNPNNQHAAYLASDCCAAWFTGNVAVTGRLFKAGGGFQIDHPLDPAEKFLAHSFVESPDMKNVYDGVVVADATGEALIDLPDWFEALNHDFRYQLTAIGAAAPDLHVQEEIRHNRFRIGGATAGMKVSWQVTGVRIDPWAKAHRIEVEERKNADDRGHYLHPHLHGAPPDKGLGELRHPRPKQVSKP